MLSRPFPSPSLTFCTRSQVMEFLLRLVEWKRLSRARLRMQ
jgi:hypothetical protein